MAVYLSRQPRYDVAEIRAHLEAAFAATGSQPAGKHAVIKPNLVNQFGHSGGTTTHPAVVEAIHDALRDGGFTAVVIADGPSINRPVDEVFANSGMTELAQRLGVDLVYLTRRSGERCRGRMAIAVAQPDPRYRLLHHVPKMKAHVALRRHTGLKNQQGICD